MYFIIRRGVPTESVRMPNCKQQVHKQTIGLRFFWFSWAQLLPTSMGLTVSYQWGRHVSPESSLPCKAEANKTWGNIRLKAVLGTLAKQIACDNLIPNFNISCAKNAKCPSGRKALDSSRAPSESPQKPHSNAVALVITSQHVQGSSPPPEELSVSFRLWSRLEKTCQGAHVWGADLECPILQCGVLMYNVTPTRCIFAGTTWWSKYDLEKALLSW